MSEIIGTPIFIALLNLEVAEKSFAEALTAVNAAAACSALGYRLPTKVELDELIRTIPELRDEYYWSSNPTDGYNYDTYLIYEGLGIEYPFTTFFDPAKADAQFRVRAVRDIIPPN